MKRGPNSNLDSVNNKNGHSILSKAFIVSKDAAIAGVSEWLAAFITCNVLECIQLGLYELRMGSLSPVAEQVSLLGSYNCC